MKMKKKEFKKVSTQTEKRSLAEEIEKDQKEGRMTQMISINFGCKELLTKSEEKNEI